MNSVSSNRSRLKNRLSRKETPSVRVVLPTPEEIDDFSRQIACFAEQTERLSSKHILLKEMLRRQQETLKEEQFQLETYLQASEVLKIVIKKTQASFAVRLADITTLCLNTIMDRPYILSVHYRDVRNKTEVSFSLDRGMKYFKDPLSSVGGGIIDLVSFSLRVSCLLMANPPLRRVLILDEPFRHLSKKLQPRAGRMLDKLSKDLSIQFIIITHDDRLVDDIDCTVFHLE